MAPSFQFSEEWKWLYKNAIKWDEIFATHNVKFPTEDGWSNSADAQSQIMEILNTVGQWCQDKVAPRAVSLDEHGPGQVHDGQTFPNEYLQQLYKEAVDLNLFTLITGREHGGLELPIALNMIIFSMISRACLASSSQLNFFPSMIDMLERFCSKEDCQRLIPKILKGEMSGSMALTEPEAGSDIGSLRTTANKGPDGAYHLNGSKMFISNAGGGFSFILARIQGAPPGLKGISLFLAEQFVGEGANKKMNYRVVSDERKMGMRGSFTCQVTYENTIAKLLGEENQGMSIMFHLMNMSRIGAGGQALGIMDACLDYVRKYAQERKQFGLNLMELPLYRKNFETWQTECDAYRAFFADSLNSFSVYYCLDLKKRKLGELNQLEQKALDDALTVVRLRTPLIKYYGAETAVEISQRAVQALGGHGLMQDHAVERLHRDSFGPLLYEGTSQIQALMVFKDLVKNIFKRPADFFAPIFMGNTTVASFVGQDVYHKEYLKLDGQFKKAMVRLVLKTLRPDELTRMFERKMWFGKEKMDKFTVHAESICQGLAYLETLKVLSAHAKLSPERAKLLNAYQKIIHPRMMAILDDWRQS